MVPSEAASRPSEVQICRVKTATEVLPLVPVTATIVPGWREKRRAAARASAARASATRMKGAPANGASRSATMAAAPLASASPACLNPSSFVPGRAKKTSPGRTLRLSEAIPTISRKAKSPSTFSRPRMSPSRVILPGSLLADLVGVGSISQTGEDGERLIWRLLHRRHAFQRLDAPDQGADGSSGVIGGGVIAAVSGRGLRIVVNREIEVFRFVGRRDGHESSEHLVMGIMAMDDFVGRAGLAADVIAGDVGEPGRAVRRVRAQEIAHRFRGLFADDAMADLGRLRLGARQERRRHDVAAVDQ